ncbi:PIG-L family deacetylase [Patescibacteria group bacterium]|nr:PIG-L family deacetylase [Patescibacteria group bacterium]
MKKLLAVFAHPDDETFSCGATLAKYHAAGWEVNLVTATKGEAGLTGPYKNTDKVVLGSIRQKELEAAAELLGITFVTFLDYQDGKLSSLTPGDLEDAVYRILAEYAPDIVVTFEPGGISNHPDHRKISLSTTFAFQKYAEDRERASGQPLRADQEPKLYYVCQPASLVRYMQDKKILPEKVFDKPWVGTADKLITAVIDITKFEKTKLRALSCHVSQEEDVDRFTRMTGAMKKKQEFFILRMQGTREVFFGKNDRVSNRL